MKLPLVICKFCYNSETDKTKDEYINLSMTLKLIVIYRVCSTPQHFHFTRNTQKESKKAKHMFHTWQQWKSIPHQDKHGRLVVFAIYKYLIKRYMATTRITIPTTAKSKLMQEQPPLVRLFRIARFFCTRCYVKTKKKCYS